MLVRRLTTLPSPSPSSPAFQTLVSLLESQSDSSIPVEHSLSHAFPSPPFPLQTLPSLLPHLPSPLLALRFFLWSTSSFPSLPFPSPSLLSSAASSLFLPSLPHLVLSLLHSFASHSPHPIPLHLRLSHSKILLHLCFHASLPHAALAVLRRMPYFACRPDAACFHVALRTFAAAADADGDDVLEVVDGMVGAGIAPTVPALVAAVRALARAARLCDARRLLERMPELGCAPGVVAYTALLDGYCESGDLEAAVAVLGEMEGGGLGGNCAPNVVSYTCLVKCLCGEKRLDEALGVLDRMAARGVMPNRVFVRTLVSGFCAEGRVGDAYGIVERVVGNGSVSTEVCYGVLAVCLVRAGKLEEAEGLLRRVIEKGVRPSMQACSVVARELCARRRFLDAHSWLDVVEEDAAAQCDSDVYGMLLLGLCEDGHVLEASALGRKVAERRICVEASCADRAVEVLRMSGEEELASEIARLKRIPAA